MIKPRLFICSGVIVPKNDPIRLDRKAVELDSLGSNPNVHVQIENVTKIFLKHLSPRLVDLLEIAAYVYAADCSTNRGEEWTNDHTTEPWERDFQFAIPVRDLTFWSREDVKGLLVQLLHFLSNDKYSFEFRQLTKDRPQQEYLQIGAQDDWPFQGVDRVLMFSGGLDSLAGAVETASDEVSRLVLVSHRSVATMGKRQHRLFNELKNAYPNQVIHVPVWINKSENLGREHTQRTRSLLYSALGTVVAESVKANGVRFFENGIVSLNLPVADEVLRARASRTTHPQSLDLLSKLCGLVTERTFEVDNPYIFKTKAEVVSLVADRDRGQLIQYTCSCAHTGYFQSKTKWHCGTCSQCIDRRMAILAAGQEGNDSETDYVSDVFTGPRQDGQETNMAVNYARHALELYQMSEVEVAARFNLELTRAVRFFPNRGETAHLLVQMHKKHGEAVYEVLKQQLERHASKLVEGSLEESSMLAMVAGQKHLEPVWHRYCDRIVKLLSAGIPITCKTHKPKDEPHLQEICDGILRAHDIELVREFPFMRWSSSLTKPDWSAESLRLWVELKYVRKKEDIRPITEAVAADITKYGDNRRRVLYVVYDPSHFVTDERAFSEPILKRGNMLIHFIR